MEKKEYVYNAKVINVVDGDTLDLEVDLGFYAFSRDRFRLVGIDTPELNSQDAEKRAAALQAKLYLQTLVGNQVVIRSHKKDKYGRFLAEVYLPGDFESINTKMLNANLGVAYDGGKRS